MMQITGQTPAQAWLTATKAILQNGNDILDREQRLKEITNVVTEIQQPTVREDSVEQNVDQKYFDEVLGATLSNIPFPDFGFSYFDRIHDYHGVDQLSYVITKLQSNPDAKSATMVFPMPEVDVQSGKVPCMITLDFKIRNGKLNATVLFRSHDYGTRALPNFIAIGKLMEIVSNEISVPTGVLVCHSISAHLYEKDIPELTLKLSNL